MNNEEVEIEIETIDLYDDNRSVKFDCLLLFILKGKKMLKMFFSPIAARKLG